MKNVKNQNSDSNKSRMILFLVLGLAVTSAFAAYQYRTKAKETQKKIQALTEQNAELNSSILALKKLYIERNQFALELFKDNKTSDKNKNLELQTKFIEKNNLVTEDDFKQFDQVQNEISNRIGEALASKIHKGKIDAKYTIVYKNIEKVEKKINDSRLELAQKTKIYNELLMKVQKKELGPLKPMPTFLAEKKYLETTKQTSL